MWNRGNRLRYLMWFVLAGVIVLLIVLIVAIAMGAEISTFTSAGILAACGVIAVALIVTSSRPAQSAGSGTDQLDGSDGGGTIPGHVANLMILADACVQREEFDRAEQLYRRAVDNGHVPALGPLSEVLYELGRDDEAAYYRRKAQEAGA